MKKRFSEEQIIGFLSNAEAGLPIKKLCLGTVSQKPVTIYGAASTAE
ncbi:transposase IS3/IS911 [Halomonas sp. KO116]|nr:transposase IS3/IS911 [Halomonas sp. KO116]